MKICIVGAGAIGGFIGTRLALHGAAKVSALARGDTLRALKMHGWRLDTTDAQGAPVRLQAPAIASDRVEALGVQDVLIIAVKGPALSGLAQSLRALIGPSTLIVPAMNGVPWWFCQGLERFGQDPLESVDPGGLIGAALPLSQVLGCVVHTSTSTPEPGLVLHKMGKGLILGEPFGERVGEQIGGQIGEQGGLSNAGRSARVQAVVAMLQAAGFDATHSADVRYDIWYKLWGNLTMNPVSAMTGATIEAILADPLVRQFCSAAMSEAAALGALIGCKVTQTPEDRHAVTARLGAFKTSMLQDAEAGRMLELDAIVSAVREIGQRLGQATPHIDALLGLTRLFARTHGLYPAAPAA